MLSEITKDNALFPGTFFIFSVLMFVNFQNVFNAKSSFEIRRSSARVYLDPQQFTYKSLSSPKRLT